MSRGLSAEEKTLKFRFPTLGTSNVIIHPAILHAHWINEVTNEFGDMVQILDNRNRPVNKIDPIRLDPEAHTKQFHLHQDRHKVRKKANGSTKQKDYQNVTGFFIHRIRTLVSLTEMKAASNVFKLMREHEFYVNEHRWSETDWDTTQLGFIYGLDPQFYNINQATTKVVVETLRQALTRTKIPKIRLVYCSPKIKK